MKKLLTALALFVLPFLASAQIENPVKWNFTSKKVNATTYELHLTATIDAGWHLYAQEAGEGPVPTTFKFTKNPLTALAGKVTEVGKIHKSFDKNFNSELKYYENTVDFVQKVTVKGKAATKVKGSVEFMVCDDHQCLPPKEIEFAVSVGGK
ncbi:protein-disulfide reductase DsbD N-terminal domain-containing protein [Chitinophaga nivalis]|uniref:Protein-disulfide reductase DsbD N-terminal domain-containing protein n=1 Tax=Chitinophaga nivalis TaxID=2991709 RepID=A0ABT3ISX2_9BACT|nr:protein-disulfide reductase DsbD N-terminal domain-containing protein [Chitinophaga nivalis]MCW3463234.1 protein-disulfide reductase DsbD N-terminal domain-containing protein [Chitinophaga nivalis]MCW3487076.1 protein-disulfide reductase DsbD N-terminal domain-containing protein [Chitinophaga nivalis]